MLNWEVLGKKCFISKCWIFMSNTIGQTESDIALTLGGHLDRNFGSQLLIL